MLNRTDNISGIIQDYNDILLKDSALNEEIRFINAKVDCQIKICQNTNLILENSSVEFKKLTSILNRKDIPIFVFSLILQGAVKYAIKSMREMSDKELADRTPGHKPEKSCRRGDRYYCTREEIISNPVPFDAIRRKYKPDIYDNLDG